MTNAMPAMRQEELPDLDETEGMAKPQGETLADNAQSAFDSRDFDETEPSWFARKRAETPEGLGLAPITPPQFRASYQPFTPPQQLEAEEAYRRRLEERFRLAQHMAGAPRAQPEHAPLQPHTGAPGFPERPARPEAGHYGYDDGYVAASTPQKARSGLGVSVPTAVFLLAVASLVGGTGGYISANPSVAANMFSVSLASLWPFGGQKDDATVAVAENVVKKDLPSARVNVGDVEGAVNAPIPLDISAFPAEPGKPLALRISGLPSDAYITKGQQVADGEWLVRAEDIRSAELVVKSSVQDELGLLVTALEADSGAAAAPAQSMKVALNLDAVPAPGLTPPPDEAAPTDASRIVPVNAPPEQASAVPLPKAISTPQQFLNEEVASYLEKGDMLLKVGDIVAARQFYMRAYELKAADGAYGVARTYDPVVYRELNVQGLKANPAKAAEWYGKAAAQGHSEAQAALARPPM